LTKKNGSVIGIKAVSKTDEIMVVTQKAMIVRCPVKDIRQTARNAQGVRIISLEKGDSVASIAKLAKED
jgi:DNA gyrase subunit A